MEKWVYVNLLYILQSSARRKSGRIKVGERVRGRTEAGEGRREGRCSVSLSFVVLRPLPAHEGRGVVQRGEVELHTSQRKEVNLILRQRPPEGPVQDQWSLPTLVAGGQIVLRVDSFSFRAKSPRWIRPWLRRHLAWRRNEPIVGHSGPSCLSTPHPPRLPPFPRNVE